MSGVVIAWPDQQDFDNGNYRELNMYETGHLDGREPLNFWVHCGIPNNPARPHFTADVNATYWRDVRMDWTDSRVAFWVDGEFVGETTRPETIPGRDMSMTLQLDAFNPLLSAGQPVTMDVDWVRVSDWDPAGEEVCKGDIAGAELPVLSACNGQRGGFLGNVFTDEAGAFEFVLREECYAIVASAPDGSMFTEGVTDGFEELHRCTDGDDITVGPLTLYPLAVVA